MKLVVALIGLLACARADAQQPSPCARTARDSVPAPTHTRLAPGEHTFDANGVRFWYCVAGPQRERTTVVFLHGGPGQGTYHLAALAGPAIERIAPIIYYDQRGSGRSGKPADGAYSMDLLVADLEELRSELDVPHMILVGHSFGGTLALEYAAKYPEHVEKIIFAAGLYSMPVQCKWRLQTLADRRPAEYAATRANSVDANGKRRNGCELEFSAFKNDSAREAYNTEAMFPDPGIAARLDSTQKSSGLRNTGELGSALFRQGLLQYEFKSLRKLTMPVLIIAGKHDGAARPEGLREMAARLPNVTFREFPNSGHFVYLDESDRFARELILFISRR